MPFRPVSLGIVLIQNFSNIHDDRFASVGFGSGFTKNTSVTLRSELYAILMRHVHALTR